jgi:hypothetical protein
MGKGGGGRVGACVRSPPAALSTAHYCSSRRRPRSPPKKNHTHPPASLQIVNGQADVVNAICDHPGIAGVTFVGSTKVAEIVAKRCRAINKRVLALGGAKNHLVRGGCEC